MEISIPDVFDWPKASEEQRAATLCRPPIPAGDFEALVSEIISRVSRDGDLALREFGEKYDAVVPGSLEVTDDEWTAAESLVDPLVLDAMNTMGRFYLENYRQVRDRKIFIFLHYKILVHAIGTLVRYR